MPEQDLEVLVTEFRADIRKYEAALRKQVRATGKAARDNEKRWRKMNKNVESGFASTFRNVRRLAAAAGVTLGVRALDRLAADSIRAGDEIGKAAKVADIGAESLQEYQFAATQAGVRQQELTDALGRFTRRRGEAIRGNKEYARAFEQLGVSIEDTNEQALEKAFRRLAEIENVTVRTSLATKVFGDDARRMALLVRDGADGLADLRKQAREAGAVLSNEAVAAMEEAQNRLSELEVQLGVRLQQATAENIDAFIAWRTALNDALVTLVEVAGGVDDLIRSWKRFLGLRASNDVRDLRIQYADLGLEIDKVRERAEKRFKLPNIRVLGSLGLVGIVSDEERLAALEEQRANILDEIEEKEAAITARKKEQAAAAERIAGGGGVGGFITGSEAEDAKRLIAEIDAAHNKAFESQIAGIERVRDERLEKLKASALSTEEKARESARAEAIASEQIAQVKRDQAAKEIELVESVLDARDRATGRFVELAEREFEARREFIEKNIQDEQRRKEALIALEEERVATVAQIRERLRQDDLQQALEEARTFEEGFRATLDIMIEDAETATARIGSLFAETFGPGGRVGKALGDATADALVFGESFTDSIGDAARAITADLISSMVQLGVQMALQAALGQTLGAAALASTSAQAAAAGAVWATPAALASLATLGANAGPASAALAATTALSHGLASAGAVGLREGGRVRGPGTGTSDSIPARLSDGEYVVNAEATRKNLAMLEAINAGRLDYIERFQSGGLVAAQPLRLPQIAAPQVNVAAPRIDAPAVNVPPADVQTNVYAYADAREATAAYLSSRAGNSQIINILQQNATAVRSITGGDR